MSSSGSNGGIPSYARPFYAQILEEETLKWNKWSPNKRAEQSVEALALRRLSDYQDLVRDPLKAMPLTDPAQIPAVAARLQEVASFASLDPSGLPIDCKKAFERLLEIERDADQYVPRNQVDVFRQFVEGEIAEYGRELLNPALAGQVLKSGTEAAQRRQVLAHQTPEEKDEQRKELERHRAAQQAIPQTLGLTLEQFDARVAAEMHAIDAEARMRLRAYRPEQELQALLNSPYPEDVREAIRSVENSLRQSLIDRPIEGLRPADVEYLNGTHVALRSLLLSEYRRLDAWGYTLAAVLSSTPEGVGPVNFADLIRVAATAMMRAHSASEIDDSDWQLTSALMFQEQGHGLSGLPGSPENLSAPLRSELAVVAQAQLEARLQSLGNRGAALKPLLEAFPVEGLTRNDLSLLSQMPSGSAADRLRRGKALFDAGYTLGALRAAIQRHSEIPMLCDPGELIRVGEMAQARGHEPGQVDSTDWILDKAKHIFPAPYNYWPAESDELQAELALLVRRDVQAKLLTLGNAGEALRTLLEQHPTEWLSVADASYLCAMSPQRAADLLARYESLRKDGYTLPRLRACDPRLPTGRPSIGDIVAVGEAARRQGINPADVRTADWFSAWRARDPDTQ
ncbi:MAG: hypothetical protein ACOYKZ_04500 [Chlamydiia bacterium]